MWRKLRAARIVKIIIDENLPRSWREYLLPHGIDAIHWRDIGNAGDADEVIFDYACEHEMVICTQDLDFTRILALRGANLPSIIQLRVDCPIPEAVGTMLLEVLKNHGTQLKDGCLITIDSKRHRLRLLPLH